eukprot:GILI01020537.1.p1 GENE.GILI01020537.1~~GILI01020537.1.p1  ORF type:complete len:338 (+),score=13.96 GILI01020537.1:80-1093(+)
MSSEASIEEVIWNTQILLRSEQYLKATLALSKSLQTGLFNSRLLIMRSQCFLKLALFENALVDASLALQIDADSVDALFCKGAALLGLNCFAEALDILEPLQNSSNSEVATFIQQCKDGISSPTKSVEKRNAESQGLGFVEQFIDDPFLQTCITDLDVDINEWIASEEVDKLDEGIDAVTPKSRRRSADVRRVLPANVPIPHPDDDLDEEVAAAVRPKTSGSVGFVNDPRRKHQTHPRGRWGSDTARSAEPHSEVEISGSMSARPHSSNGSPYHINPRPVKFREKMKKSIPPAVESLLREFRDVSPARSEERKRVPGATKTVHVKYDKHVFEFQDSH